MSKSAQIDLEIVSISGEFVLPDEFAGLYLRRGTHWHPYISGHIGPIAPGLQRAFGPDGLRPASAFYHMFPLWDHASKNLGHQPDPDWNETQHNLFKATLNWLKTQSGFAVRWTYFNPLYHVFNGILLE